MSKEEESMTAKERLVKRSQDQEFVACQKAEEAQEIYEEETPLRNDLANVGVFANGAWDLMDVYTRYPPAIPVLMEHWAKDYSNVVKEGIVRALTVPEGAVAWKTMIQSFAERTDPNSSRVKAAIGCALKLWASETNVSDLFPLISDRRHGENRLPLVDALRKVGTEECKAVLRGTVGDPEIGPYAKNALKKMSNAPAGWRAGHRMGF